MRDDWVREDAFDNRGVEYDPIGQFRGVAQHMHAFSTRPALCLLHRLHFRHACVWIILAKTRLFAGVWLVCAKLVVFIV